MDTILPIIHMADLQRHPKKMLEELKDYAIIQSHGHDRAFVLHPRLGRILLESGMLEVLRTKSKESDSRDPSHLSDADKILAGELQHLIGPVLRELSKK